MTPVRLAVVGCGYVTRALHLPAVAGTPAFELVGLVDAEVSRARHLADEYGAVWVADDHRDALGRVDAVLLAVPNHLHAPMAVEFLRAGAHVLVEKPMATTVGECDRMIAIAAESGQTLAVGLMRRFYGWTSVVARFVRDRPLGAARRFELIEGERYRQRVQSGFRFDRDQAGGGVLADRGIHVLDLLAWWFGECEDLEYRDDAAGGVEAECRIGAEFAGGVSGDVVLTRLRDVPNTHRFEFERGTLVLEDPGSPAPLVRVDVGGHEWEPAGQRTSAATADAWLDVFRRQLADFAGAIREGREPMVSGREGRRSVALLNRCYALRRPLAYPWELGVARL